jgi:hypothetical protein
VILSSFYLRAGRSYLTSFGREMLRYVNSF